ncbi:uncharacterized protein BDV14DRAFT_204898 [Aspergillus stella-maris]|uniref:uncharacterized protein n=1 Tax=Aspergillus stella-maris TaxID=1810926 RepID=UPI003CCD42C1
MPERSSIGWLKDPKYPLTVPDLSEACLKELVRILATDPPLDVFPYYEQYTNDKIQEAIKKLPPTLCRKSSLFSLPGSTNPASTLCATHKRLNPYIVSHIFRLIKRETENHLDLVIGWYPGYPERLQWDVKEVVQGLRSLKGLWQYPDPDQHPVSEAIRPQQNKCEACIISRVITDLENLRNLRIALLSRTPQRCSYRSPPKLFGIIEEALNQRHGQSLEWVINASSQLSMALKQARKNAARCNPSRRNSRRCSSSQCEPRRWPNSTPPEEPSDTARILNLSPHPNTRRRRPSSQTVYFCMLSESISPPDVPNEHTQKSEGSDYDKRQSELIQDILDFYLKSSQATSPNSSLTSTSPYRPRLIDENNSARTGNSSRSSSSWEDNWDTSTITVQRTSTINRKLVSQIGDLLAEGHHSTPPVIEPPPAPDPDPYSTFDGEVSPKSSPRRRVTIVDHPPEHIPNPNPNPNYALEVNPQSTPCRRITIVDPPTRHNSHKPTVEDYEATLNNWGGFSFYSDNSRDGKSGSDAATEKGVQIVAPVAPVPRKKSSETTTWSMLWHEANDESRRGSQRR